MRKRWQRLSVPELRQLWDLWKTGSSAVAISEQLAVAVATVYDIVHRRGGIAPPERTRALRTLTLAEREEISRGLGGGESVRSLARRLGRAPSTISREIHRHGGTTKYRATAADARAWQRARRPKRCRLATHRRLRQVVLQKLGADWSPQQIAQWLVTTYPDDPTMRVSHETLYRTLYIQARGALKKELVTHLRRQQPHRQHRRGSVARSRIPEAVSISARPPSVEDRAIPGHWEGDLLAGNQHSHLVTLVERHSRFVMLARLPDRESTSVVDALIRRTQHLPKHLQQSLTWDRGTEMVQHARFTVATDMQVYFCDPYSPWQRGSNENTNGLLRQYFPKGMDLSGVTQRQLDVVANKLNTRPRQTLNWKTPAEVLSATVAPTG